MRLVSFEVDDDGAEATAEFEGVQRPDGALRTGVVAGGDVVDLTGSGIGLPGDMLELLRGGPAALERAAAAAADPNAERWPLDAVRLLAPVPHPPKVLAIGMNYRAHVAEMGRDAPEHQYWFNKQRTCVVGPGATIVVPARSTQVDYEGELAVVIGRRCRQVSAERAHEVVAGYSVMNDVSVRDWQWRTPTFTLGKSYDSHGPLGPWLVTTDEVPDPQDLRLRTWVNDGLRQDSSTSDMVFTVCEQIACLSEAFTLEVGDVITTGTPAGVGAASDPPRWLVPGDVVRIEVERVGILVNPVGAEGPEPG